MKKIFLTVIVALLAVTTVSAQYKGCLLYTSELPTT